MCIKISFREALKIPDGGGSNKPAFVKIVVYAHIPQTVIFFWQTST